MTDKIAIIGDVHGKIDAYVELTKNDAYSIQVGDMGIGFNEVVLPERNQHFFIHGNHDNPDECAKHPNFLGRFGQATIAGVKIFFVSGGYSIDQYRRKEGVTWWRNEELSTAESFDCCLTYGDIKPDIVISHDCPSIIRNELMSHHQEKTTTVNMLSAMFEIHRPKHWFFGHHHVSHTQTLLGTTFQCLAELEKTHLTVA